MAFLRSFSISTVILTLFVLYVSYSLWTIIQLFIPPTCSNNCLKPLIEEKPNYQFLAYASVMPEPKRSSDVILLHKESPFIYGENKEYQLNITLPKEAQANGTMYLHIFLASIHTSSKSWQSLLSNQYTVYATTQMTKYQVPEAKSFKLLGETSKGNSRRNASSTSQRKVVKRVPESHFIGKIVFNLLTQPVSLPKYGIPYEIGRHMSLTNDGKYLPVLYINQMSQRLEDLVLITKETKTLNITLQYAPISYGKLRMLTQFEGGFDSMIHLGFTEKDLDEVKGIFSDSNLYLLCVTFIVATFHLVFDFLAFKNDISFWRGRATMEGISSSTVAWRLFSQIVIFFYLIEEKTSLLVVVPAAIAAVIELWKVTKAFHVRLNGWKLESGRTMTKEESETRMMDSEGLRYLTYIMYPLCITGAVYSLLYMPHKSWYSWLINSLVNGVYAFGFLFMLPQLFINYKLKSVAHLPWRAFMYKAFNTFIDDLFAFIIAMPTAHRVACFRDDVVFVIFLYQRWLYPVDKGRINEFGTSGEDEKKKRD